MKMEKKTLYSLGLAIYLLFVFLSEIAYRNGFYNASVEYIKEIEQGGFLEYFYVFWGLIVFYGIIGAGIFITLVFLFVGPSLKASESGALLFNFAGVSALTLNAG